MQDAHFSKQDQSLGELFSELAREMSTLVRSEVTLAKAEMSQKASRLGKDLGFVAAGAALAYAGLLALLAAVIAMLVSAGMPVWGAALLVGLVVAGGGAYLAYHGLQALKREDLVPHETIETLKEDRSGPGIRARAA
jgi:threonine/homoserine/homoserine lactone efflux protein